MWKKSIKKLFACLAFFGKPKTIITIASCGRAGSTMLFDAIASGYVEQEFRVGRETLRATILKKLCAGYVVRIATLPQEPYLVCKTHDTFVCPPRGNYKYIFIYGDPLDSAASVEKVVEREGQDWFRLHQYYLNAEGDYDDLFQKDVLNYRGQLESWLTQNDPSIICIDYDDLWTEINTLSDFLGFEVVLPPRRARRIKSENKSANMELFSHLRILKETLKKHYASRRKVVQKTESADQ